MAGYAKCIDLLNASVWTKFGDTGQSLGHVVSDGPYRGRALRKYENQSEVSIDILTDGGWARLVSGDEKTAMQSLFFLLTGQRK